MGVDYNHINLKVDTMRSKSFAEGTKDFVNDNGYCEEITLFHVEPTGTHITGIIAAKNNNSGVVGIIPNAKVAIIRIFRESGETEDDTSTVLKGL